MPNLIETYARSTGLTISDIWTKEDFFPLSVKKYITLSAGSGQAAKNYSFYQIVIDMLNPIIGTYGISILQLGDKDTPLFSGTYDMRAQMNIAQSTYCLKNAVLHLGNDSWSAHVAGHYKIPLVALYGTTDKTVHGPHWKDKEKTILLESHRNGNKPSFGAEQSNKTIDLITPEDVANSVLSLLNIPDRINQKTQLIGSNYLQTIIEIIPNTVPTLKGAPDLPLIIRMDYEHNEAGLQAILQTGYKIHLFTKTPISLHILATFKAQILSYNHEIDDSCPYDYVKIIPRIIPGRSFFSRTPDLDVLARLRFQFFDVCNIEHLTHRTKTMFFEESARYLNKPLDKESKCDILQFRTNKYLVSKDKIYLSYAHLLNDISTPRIGSNCGWVIDCDEFWRETNHQMIYI